MNKNGIPSGSPGLRGEKLALVLNLGIKGPGRRVIRTCGLPIDLGQGARIKDIAKDSC